ncbi:MULTISPECIES: sigma-70 family RNA polymerase sigma factor [Streptomyces]|nr:MULTISPECIES: sigma-70 family RNA polymerase sigma factor [Streptomyces]MZD16968.1 sigma-70 family RNA polymerase sigma factor [Streptomyces sp. SID5476]
MAAFHKPEDDDQNGGDPQKGASPKPLRLTPEQIPHATALVKECYEPICRMLLRATRDLPTAEDLTQETLYRMCRQIARGHVFTGRPIAYAMKIATHLMIDQIRKNKKMVEMPLEGVGDASSAWLTGRGEMDPTAATVRFIELLHEVQKAIGNDAEYTVWACRVLLGMSGVEVAELLDVSAATVSRRYQSAVRKAGGLK